MKLERLSYLSGFLIFAGAMAIFEDFLGIDPSRIILHVVGTLSLLIGGWLAYEVITE